MKRVIFIGQAMPRVKGDPYDWPTLNDWLHSVGISDKDIKENFFYTALVDYFPGAKNGSHIVPSEAEIKKERKRLERDFRNFNPDIVVTIGKLSLSHCLCEEVILLKDYISKAFEVCPYKFAGKKVLVIPFPHPSGASTWYRRQENKRLLNRALTILRDKLE